MDEATYRSWWNLHLRKAGGERLDEEEQARYRAGLATLHKEEQLDGDIAARRRGRQAITAAEAERDELRARIAALVAEIVSLESAEAKTHG
jgi:hypothetical protein